MRSSSLRKRSKSTRLRTQSTPNRLRGLYGAAKAAQEAGQQDKAATYFRKLAELTKDADTDRVEIREAKAFVAKR